MRKEFRVATAQHSTAQHSTAQHSTAQHRLFLCYVKKWKVQLLYMLIQSNPFIAMR